MTFRSRLFATVALPVLSVSLVATPTLADALMKPFEVAQESSGPTEEELLQQQQEEQRRAAEEEAQRQAEEQQRQAEEQQRAAEEEAQRQAEEQQRQAEEQQRAAEEEAQRQAEEQKAAEAEAQRAAEEEAQRQAEQQKAAEEEAQRAADEEAQRQAEQQKAAEEEAQRAAEQQKAAEEEAQRAADQQKAADQEAQQAAEQQKAAEEEAQRAADEQQRQAEEQQKAAEEQQQQQQTEEQPQQPAEEQQAEQPAGEPQGEQPAVTEEVPAEPATEQPSTAETGEAPVVVVPEVVDTLSEEQKQEIAEDPGKTDETVVLPVENGAAVLDSDKDADNLGGQTSREERRKQREELRAQEEVPLPDSDVSAQAAISEEVREAVPQKIEAAIKEEGKRLDAAPVFEVPQTTNIINNTVVNNTVNNNVVNNNITRVDVVEKIDNRTVLSVGDRLFVRGDDRPRLRRDSEEVYYDNLARGRTRETIVRPGGVQIVTIYDRYGDIIQRSRVGRDGREYIIAYAPEREDDAPRADFVDVGYELPPMRLRIPLRDYIVDTSSEPDRDYYDFLSEPPVERVERVYTIDEVKHSARLRDKVRRIDLDTITFATGSAEVPMSQARTLRKVAEAMEKVLDKDPGETFLIEGHTDAVGSDKSNLILSDLRAEAVANLLTEVYGIPPENLQTQGYGERFLKVRTDAAEQQNRRVTIRRVTTLVRPVANAN